MAKFQALVKPWYGGHVLAGNCLAMAQKIMGAPVMHPSATAAANATRHRHYSRSMPDAPCVVWLDHWGAYGQPGREVYANWGHVVTYEPGKGFASSSPNAGEVSTPYFYSTLAGIEAAFNCSFRFWSEDINGKRVCQEEEEVTEKDITEIVERVVKGVLTAKVKDGVGGKNSLAMFLRRDKKRWAWIQGKLRALARK